MSASFRDPSGKLLDYQGRILRVINKNGIDDFEASCKSVVIESMISDGKIITMTPIPESERKSLTHIIEKEFDISRSEIELIVEHDRVSIPSYPYEWTAEMLHSAARLTLELAKKLLSEGIGLKDATPYNILFKGSEPIFVDWLSFEKRDPKDPTWLPQSQFIRTFILPLLANKEFGIGMGEVFLSNRDGLDPERVFDMTSGLKKFRSPFFSTVTLPKLLTAKESGDNTLYQKKQVDEEKASFILGQQFKHLEKTLDKANPTRKKSSEWSAYVGTDQHFTDQYFNRKAELVSEWIKETAPTTVLDIGCNTGFFSKLAAENGADVLAIDQDEVSVGEVFTFANRKDLNILPLVVDITRPTPATGWRNCENTSFLERVSGNAEMVMMLAVIHHMLVTERIPIRDIFSLIAEIATKYLILEFVPREDKMFKKIARGRDILFSSYDQDSFEIEAERQFTILHSERLPDSERRLFLLEKKD